MLKGENLAVKSYVLAKIQEKLGDEGELVLSAENEGKIQNFTSKLTSKWAKSSRNLSRFLEAEKICLDSFDECFYAFSNRMWW